MTDNVTTAISMGLTLLSCLCIFFLEKRQKTAQEQVEYKMYETAPSIEKKWSDKKLKGKCDICGMSDAPLVIKRKDAIVKAKCKWCAELDNVNYHLQYNGVRRFKK